MNKPIALIALVFVLFLTTPGLAVAQAGHVSRPNGDGTIQADQIEFFFDQAIPDQLAAHAIPGATVSAVKDGELVFANGYGYADAANQTPVDAVTTRFHIGSVTKLFTWTAVMQLAEQGKLDLHTDVNTYLKDIHIPPAYGKPVTLHHLMTHTAGFDDQISNLFNFESTTLRPLELYLKQEMPKRVYPPGDIIAYSNWGAGLAGLIVQEVSGEPYEQYIEKHILTPLAMTNTTLHQPSEGMVSKGYATTPGGAVVPVQEYLPNVPAGAISATAADMANFMIAHLQNGVFNGRSILKPETAEIMHSPHYQADPRLNGGFTYGFMDFTRNGQRVLFHSGGTSVFYSMFILVPEQNLGFFYSFNGTGGSEARWVLRQQILDRFFPVENAAIQPMDGYAGRVKQYEGLYRESRFGFSTVDKLMYAFSWVVTAKANPDGTLAYRGENWIETEPGVFRQVGGQGALIFTRDPQGRIARAYQDIDPHEAQIRMESRENPILVMIVGAVLFLINLSGFGVWAAAGRRKRKKPLSAPESNLQTLARRLAAGIGGLHLVFYAWVITAAGVLVFQNPLAIMGSMEKILKIPLALPLLAGLATITMTVVSVLLLCRRVGTAPFRGYFLAFTASAVFYMGWLAYWNLLGWNF